MANSPLRRNWQHFKLRHPEFEKKSKHIKLDVGPQLDKLSDAVAEHWRVVCAAQRRADEVARIGKIVQAALRTYEGVCLSLGPLIPADFARCGFQRYVNSAVEEYSRLSLVSPKRPDLNLVDGSVVEKVVSEEKADNPPRNYKYIPFYTTNEE